MVKRNDCSLLQNSKQQTNKKNEIVKTKTKVMGGLIKRWHHMQSSYDKRQMKGRERVIKVHEQKSGDGREEQKQAGGRKKRQQTV